jgi:hypothetical protein
LLNEKLVLFFNEVNTSGAVKLTALNFKKFLLEDIT